MLEQNATGGNAIVTTLSFDSGGLPSAAVADLKHPMPSIDKEDNPLTFSSHSHSQTF